MINKTQMINVKLGILYLYRKFFNFLFLFFFFPYLHSQNISTNDSDIATQEKVIVSTNDSIKTKNNKGSIYISSGVIFYSENNLHNVKIVKLSETKNKTVYTKPISKKVSKKIFKEKNLELVQKKIRMMVSGLASAGLDAKQTSNEDLRIISDISIANNIS